VRMQHAVCTPVCICALHRSVRPQPLLHYQAHLRRAALREHARDVACHYPVQAHARAHRLARVRVLRGIPRRARAPRAKYTDAPGWLLRALQGALRNEFAQWTHRAYFDILYQLSLTKTLVWKSGGRAQPPPRPFSGYIYMCFYLAIEFIPYVRCTFNM
jgi:hypothetical protein